VNAAFTHTNPFGNRFNGPGRGAWYAAFSLDTAGVEVAFHKSEELREINWQEKEAFLYADFLADFRGEFHDIRKDSSFAKCLDPNKYAASQKLAEELLDKGSAGVVYPSVRHSAGTCMACFRPALVNNVRRGGQVSVEFENALAAPIIRPTF
jgi:RES domain-containing protein